MKKEQVLEATDGSIQHWTDIYEGKGLLDDHYDEDCALCELFYVGLGSCDDCPLEAIGQRCGRGNHSAWLFFDKAYDQYAFKYGLYLKDVKGKGRQKLRFFSLLMVKMLEMAKANFLEENK